MGITLELPCGRDLPGGRVERSVTITKIKGKVQRDVARIASKKNTSAGAVVDAILRPTLKTAEGSPVGPGELNSLFLGDRDWLIFQLHKLTKGSEIESTYTCEECKKPSMVVTDIDTMEIFPLGDDVPWWDGKKVVAADQIAKLSEEERQELLCRVIELKNPELEAHGVFRYPRGIEQRSLKGKETNPLDLIWKLMSVSLLYWKDPDNELLVEGRGGAKQTFWDEVDSDILTWAQEQFTSRQPGVDNRIEIECCECDATQEVAVSAVDFLFPKLGARG